VRTTSRDRRVELALFALVLALAAILRLYRLDVIDVRFDEASAPQLALGIARGQLLPVAPFSGSVANHPPVYLYLLAIPYLFTRDFLAIAAYRALLDVLAIALCWWLCRRFFNVRIALVASLLFAVAPWAIQFARKTWLAPLPVATTILLFGILEADQRRNPWGWAIAGWGLALSVGAHLSTVYLVPVLAVALILGRRALRPIPVLVGVAPLVALTAVYFGHDAGQGFRNLGALAGGGGSEGGGGPATFALDALRLALWSSGGGHLSDLTGGAFHVWRAQVPEALNLIDTLQMALLVGGAILLSVQVARRSSLYDSTSVAVLVLWLVVPVALQVWTGRRPQIHYFVPLYPVPFIIMALGLDAAVGAMRSPPVRAGLTWAAATAVVAIVGWQVFTTQQFTDFVQRHDTGIGGYGAPVRGALEVAQLARAAVQAGERRDVIVVAPGANPAIDEPATVMDVVLADVPHRFVNADAGMILRDDAAQYIFTPGTERARAALMDNLEPTDVFTQGVRVRAGGIGDYVYVRSSGSRLAPLREHPAAWSNGVGMLGYRIGADRPLLLQVLLRVFREAAPGTDYHWFNHVYAEGERIAQADGGGVHPSNWRAGDILLQWFDIPVGDGAAPDRIRIGSYVYPDVQPVMVVDSAGAPIGDGVDLPIGRGEP
jgi:4-amino-4-deoxy-L-arabinose transferase-like glycosyltransferase